MSTPLQTLTARKSSFSVDWLVLLLYLTLIVFGWLSVCGASHEFGDTDIFSWSSRSGKQLVWIICSFGLGFCLLMIDEKYFDMLAAFLYVSMMLLLLITPLLATNTKGSLSWIKLGPVSLQPAEFAKCATSLAVAKMFSQFGFSLGKRKDLLKAVGLVMLPMVLIVMQRETGSALVYLAFFLVFYREGMYGSVLFCVFAAVLYFVVGLRYANDIMPATTASVGEYVVLVLIFFFTIGFIHTYLPRERLRKPLLYGVGCLIAAYLFSWLVKPFDVSIVQIIILVMMIFYLLWQGLTLHKRAYHLIAVFAIGSVCFLYASDFALNNVLQEHQQQRINVLLGIDSSVTGAGYNVHQSKIAIGSGGLHGKGFMNGTQTKLKYVPEQDTDFIFCTVGEEQGFIGSAAVLSLFLALILRLIWLAERQSTVFGRVYGYCVMSILFFHVFINVGMVMGLTPVIGIPLPFFSYGGSSLWGFTILLFIFLRMDACDRVRLHV